MFDFLKKTQTNETDKRQCMSSLYNIFKKKTWPSKNERPAVITRTATEIQRISKHIRRPSELHFFQGGVRKNHQKFVKWIGRLGFIAKGVVYGCIGVLTLTNLTGAWTPNGSQGNESPQVI